MHIHIDIQHIAATICTCRWVDCSVLVTVAETEGLHMFIEEHVCQLLY